MGLARTPPLVDLNFVKTTQAVTDGTGENLLTLCLAAYVNKAHGDTSNRYAWSVFHILHSRKTRKSLKNVKSPAAIQKGEPPLDRNCCAYAG